MSTPVAERSTLDGFDEFFRVEYPKLLALGRALAPAAAGDLAQETMIRSCRHWPEVSEMDIPGAWVRRVVAEVAAVLGVATGTVKSSLARARKTLARQFPNEEDAR